MGGSNASFPGANASECVTLKEDTGNTGFIGALLYPNARSPAALPEETTPPV